MSVRRLNGWEPRNVSWVERVDGIDYTFTSTEPEWDFEQVDLLIAMREIEAETGPHGFLMSEATDPANQFAFQGDEFPTTDWAEKARLDSQSAYYARFDSKENPLNRNGLIFGVKRRSSRGTL